MQHLLRLVLFVLVSLVLTSPALAQTYHVDPDTGNDANSCATAQAEGTPKQTIQDVITDCSLGPGDFVQLHGGTYAESISLNGIAGSSGNYITFTEFSGETAIVQNSGGQALTLVNVQWVQFINIDFDGYYSEGTTISMTSALNANIRFQGCIIRRTGRNIGGPASDNMPSNTNGITGGGNNNIFVGNFIYDNGLGGYDHGFYMSGDGHILDGNEIYENAGHGIQKYPSGDNWIIRNNLVYANGQSGHQSTMQGGEAGPGIGLYGGSGSQVYNNIIYDNYEAGITTLLSGGNDSDDEIYFNTIYGNLRQGIWDENADNGDQNGLTIRNNIVYANTQGDIVQGDPGATPSVLSNNLTNDPDFVNSGTGNFHLQITSTNAIDQGIAVTGIDDDFDGISRPQGAGYDIGALEFVSGSGGGAISFDDSASCEDFGTSVTCGVVTGTGSNRILVAGVSIFGTETVTSATYNSVALESIISDDEVTGTRCEMWYLKMPDAGTHNLVITLNGSAYVAVGAMVLNNVEQSGNSWRDGAGTSGTNAASPATLPALTTVANDWVVDALYIDNVEATPGSGQGNWLLQNVQGIHGLNMSTKTATTTSTSTSWTYSAGGGDDWSLCGVSFKEESPSGPGGGQTLSIFEPSVIR